MPKPDEQTTPPKRKRGRPRLPEGTTLKRRDARLSDDHWGAAAALGDGKHSEGLRVAIEFTCDAKGVEVGKGKRKPKKKGDSGCIP